MGRSRLLDHLLFRVPTVVTEGDALGAVMAARGAATLVPPADPEALAEQIGTLVDDDSRRREMSLQAASLAEEHVWESQLASLEGFLAAPYLTRDRYATSGYVDFLKEFLPHSRLHSRTLVKARRIMRREGTPGLLRRAIRRAVGSVRSPKR